MNKLMLLSGAALFALSSPTLAQSGGSAPSPDAAASAPAPANPAPPPAADAPAPAPDAAPPAVALSPAPAADAAATTPAAPAVAQTAPAADAAAAPPAAPASASADASAKVNADWAKYDEGNKGKLTPLEFGNWVMAAKGQDMTAQVEKTKTSKKANLPAIKVLNETATDFAKADTDKDRMISPNELAVYLSA